MYDRIIPPEKKKELNKKCVLCGFLLKYTHMLFDSISLGGNFAICLLVWAMPLIFIYLYIFPVCWTVSGLSLSLSLCA